jgi:hypothetical protein
MGTIAAVSVNLYQFLSLRIKMRQKEPKFAFFLP